MNQLGGNTAQTNVAYTGMQATVAPDSAHLLIANNKTEATLAAGDEMSVSMIPALVSKAQGTLLFPIKPVVIKGIEVAGVLFLHPVQVRDLKRHFTTGEWGDIYRAALQGGQVTGNPVFTGAEKKRSQRPPRRVTGVNKPRELLEKLAA